MLNINNTASWHWTLELKIKQHGTVVESKLDNSKEKNEIK